MSVNKERVGTLKKRANGDDCGMGRCDVCQNTCLEKYKLCLTCLTGKRPERTKDNSREIKVAVPTGELYY